MAEEKEKKKGFFARLREGLSRTRDGVISGMDRLFSGTAQIDGVDTVTVPFGLTDYYLDMNGLELAKMLLCKRIKPAELCLPGLPPALLLVYRAGKKIYQRPRGLGIIRHLKQSFSTVRKKRIPLPRGLIHLSRRSP